jgi:putative heme-binding domain-containing protein
LLTDRAVAAADAGRGRIVFHKTCAVCHKMSGVGGELGPDITGSNRADLDYILENMLDPSGEIPEGYQLVVVNTRDGRTYSGTVASETDRELVLRVVGADPVTIAKSEILSRDKQAVSLMPEGLLSSLNDREVTDLVVYLRTAQQVELTTDLKRQLQGLPIPWSERDEKD